MSETQTSNQLQLTERIIGSVDLSRLIRELKNLDEWMHQASLRTPGEAMKLPKTSQSLEEVAAANHVSLLEVQHRQQLIDVLVAFSTHAPRVHMSFAVEPSVSFTKQLIVWLRRNAHPLMLLEIGLQPTLAAGCIVRTQNKLFDMSLRHRFKENRHLLVEKIAGLPSEKTAQPVTTPAPEVVASEKAGA